MVRIGTVWDRTTEVIGGRAGILAGIAAATIVLPTAIRDGWTAYSAPLSGGPVGALLTVLWLGALVFGMLAITAVASDPATTRADAYRVAGTRFGPAIAVVVVMLLALFLAALPAGALLASSGMDLQAAQAGLPQPAGVATGAIVGAGAYVLVLSVVVLFVFARLCLVYPLVVNERRGLRVFAASWQLTRGLTWKLVGVSILYVIVAGVATMAATAIVGVVFGLVLGQEQAALTVWLASLAGALVSAALTVVQASFFAQLYLAVRGGTEPVSAA